MDLLQLEYFKTVARLEHMSNAARKLNISQPALSNTISRLEEELGLELFDRQGRNIYLNPYGKKFLKRVNTIFFELDEGVREIHDLANIIEHSISIAAVIPNLLTSILTLFIQENPGVKMVQYSSFHGRMLKQLENFEIDFAITTSPSADASFDWLPLAKVPLYLTVPKHHPLAGIENVMLKELVGEKFINLNENFEFRQRTDFLFQEAGFLPNTYIELEDINSIFELVAKDYGVTLHSKFNPARANYYKNLVQIPIADEGAFIELGLVWNKRHYLSKTALKFKDFLIKYFEQRQKNP